MGVALSDNTVVHKGMSGKLLLTTAIEKVGAVVARIVFAIISASK
jgi:hypothetical protein